MNCMNKKISPCTYLQKKLYENIDKFKKKKRNKVTKEEFEIPEYNDYESIVELNYNVSQLRSIARYYKQKISGNKSQLKHRLYNYLKYSLYAIKVQRFFRGYICRLYISLKGPALYRRTLCVNESDFYSLDKIKNIPNHQFISFMDEGYCYGCDICSLYNWIKMKGNLSTNPYTRKKFSKTVLSNLYKLISLAKVCNIKIRVKLEEDEIKNLSLRKKLEYKTYTLFSKIDEFGIITNSQWLLDLSRYQMIRFVKELYDIFFYRAGLTPPVKIKICPPIGNPFHGIDVKNFAGVSSDNTLKKIISIIENFISKGRDRESKVLGCYYVLGALTLVNESAKESLPWLYESFKLN